MDCRDAPAADIQATSTGQIEDALGNSPLKDRGLNGSVNPADVGAPTAATPGEGELPPGERAGEKLLP